MENLTILSTNVSKSAKEVINGNTVNYSWSYEEGKEPAAINFNVIRGVEGDENYNGNTVVFGAFYPETNKYDFNNNDLQPGDEDLYMPILAVCKGIVQEIES